MKKKSSYQYLILLLLSFSTVSCAKSGWFDIKSDKRMQIPSTLKDMQTLMDHMDLYTHAPTMPVLASDGIYFKESRIASLTPLEINSYTWTNEQVAPSNNDWNAAFKRIYYANLVLDEIDKINTNSPDTKKEKDYIKGAAYFVRAKTFYQLAQTFSPIYEKATATSKLGIPLRLEADVNIPSKRSNLQETYDQIFDDLKNAVNLLPDVAGLKTRPNKVAADALLARIYLSIEHYEEAEKMVEKVLEKNSTLMDYNTITIIGAANPFTTFIPEVIYLDQLDPNVRSLRFAEFFIEKDFYNTYSANDLRKHVYFHQNQSSGEISYRGSYASREGLYLFNGLATDEMFLIRAECYARRGNVSGAMKDLNDLLKTRWNPDATIPSNPYNNKVATDKNDALEQILAERRKELCLRGLRWSDLRRLNKDPSFQQTFTKSVNGKTYTLEPNSYKYTFPIPVDVLERSKIEPNEGWER